MHDKNPAKATFDQVLTSYTSPRFLADLEYALAGLDLLQIGHIFRHYHLDRFEDSIEFLKEMPPRLNGWIHFGKGSVRQGRVQELVSRCFLCDFDAEVIVYGFPYRHKKAPFPMNGKLHLWEFGIHYYKRHGILQGIRFCDTYLGRLSGLTFPPRRDQDNWY